MKAGYRISTTIYELDFVIFITIKLSAYQEIFTKGIKIVITYKCITIPYIMNPVMFKDSYHTCIAGNIGWT